MTPRRQPSRRTAQTFTLAYQHMPFTLTIGRFDTDQQDVGAGGGSIAEVFVSGPKSGEHMHAIVRDAAIMISLALQAGWPVSALQASVSRDQAKQPQSIIGAVLDALAEEDKAHEPPHP